jgi:hypothetical protein
MLTTRRMLLLLPLALACKSAKEREEARRAKEIIEAKAGLRERLRQRKIAREQKKEYLQRHPELLNEPISPDQRPTAEPHDVPPQLMGATPAPRDKPDAARRRK